MAKYRKISPRIWNDAKVRELSDRGKLAFLFLLTHPTTTPFGAIRANAPGLAYELGWSTSAFKKALNELISSGMAVTDEAAHLIWFPNFLKHNKPESPNVVKSWAGAFEDLPECELRERIYKTLETLAKKMSEAFAKAFREAFDEALSEGLPEGLLEGLPEGFRNPSPNKEQEQEQEQNIKNPTTPPRGQEGKYSFSNPPSSGKASPKPDALEPGIEFLELRQFYDANVRPEGPLAGLAEYKALKAARDYTGANQWPGLDFIMDDIEKRKEARVWNSGYEVGLARYLAERTWLAQIVPRQNIEQKSQDDREEEIFRRRMEKAKMRDEARARGEAV